jgi:lipocalin-like protein
MERELAPVGTPVLPVSVQAQAANEELYGTWRLESFTQTILATGETIDVFGKAPQGFIHYGRDGRMMVLMVKDARPKPSDLSKMTDQERVELFKTLVAYAGTYEVDAKTVTHHLDISWNQIFTGTDQVRNIEFDGCKFIMSTNPQPRSQDGDVAISVLTWERLE